MVLNKNKKYIFAVGFGLFAFIVTFLLKASGAFYLLEAKFSDLLYRPSAPSDKIVMVQIDDKSLDDKLGLGQYNDWTRANFAKVVENLNQYQPKVIAFDIFFKAKKDPTADQELADALSKSNNVVLPFGYTFRMNGDENKLKFTFGNGDSKPLDILTANDNTKLSLFNLQYGNEEVIRSNYPGKIKDDENQVYLGMPFQAFSSYIDAEQPQTSDIKADQYIIHKSDGTSITVPLEQYKMLFNYFSKPQTEYQYKTFSFVDVYNNYFPGVDPEAVFKDKIVIIGPSASYFKDSYLTPISKTDVIPGMEIHANTIQTLLDGKFLRNIKLWEDGILLLLIAALGSAIFMYGQVRWSVAFLLGFGVLYGVAAWFIFNAGIILDLVHPYILIVLNFISIYIFRYLNEFKQKNVIKNAFSKYLDKSLVDEISDHPENLKLGGDRKEITVIFTDIAHFTSISEKLKPESLVALLNEYFEAMSEVIMAEGGTVDKFEGDAIMAFFGAPLPQDDHAKRACRTAFKMRQKLETLKTKWKNDPPLPGGESKPDIDFRCGISSGEVIVGNMGSSKHIEYTVMGDVVNLGSRLEGANKKYDTKIMLSSAVQTKIENEFETRELDTIRVVGKTEPIKVYELLNYKGQMTAVAQELLKLYNEGVALYHTRKFADALAKFDEILQKYPEDGPSKLYKQRSEVLRDFPPKDDWDGVFEMGSK